MTWVGAQGLHTDTFVALQKCNTMGVYRHLSPPDAELECFLKGKLQLGVNRRLLLGYLYPHGSLITESLFSFLLRKGKTVSDQLAELPAAHH